MSLDNYTNLKTSIDDWSHRNDVTALIDDFILLAEKEMYANSTAPLRCQEIEQRVTDTASTTTRYLALPARFLEMREMTIESKTDEPAIFYRTPSQLKVDDTAGTPAYYTITDQIEFDRVFSAAETVQMQIYQKTLPLDATNSTNAVLTAYPDIYLFGALWALNRWANREDLVAQYYSQFINAIRGANRNSKMGREANSLRATIQGPTP